MKEKMEIIIIETMIESVTVRKVYEEVSGIRIVLGSGIRNGLTLIFDGKWNGVIVL